MVKLSIMSKKAAIKRHVQSNIVARVIYRIICVGLIGVGLFGLFIAFIASEQVYRYDRRDEEAIAKVTSQVKETDEYGFETCRLKYKFTIDGQEYSSQGVIENNYNCQVAQGDEITIRYQEDSPSNNAYGDNEQDKDLWFIGASVVTFISILPLGFGFIGLLAIHKAIKAEDEVEETKAERARRRAYRRKLKSQEADSNNESQE